MMLDFDLAWPGGGPGEGVSGSRSLPWNGPLRHRGPPCACELIWAQAVLLLLLVGRSGRRRVGASGAWFTRP
jgi:hypothetical protein